MMITPEKIQRITSKGQITLPITWRRKNAVHTIVVREKEGMLEISPLRIQDERDEDWVTIFDAVRDNNGKGVPAEEILASLKRLARKKKAHGRAR